MNKASEANNFLPIGIVLLCLTPAIMVLLPWDFGSDMNPYRGFMRGNSLPVTIVELLFVLLAMSQGFSPVTAIVNLPRATRVGSLLFLIATVWTTIWVAQSWIIAFLGMIKLFAHAMFGLAMFQQLTRWTADQRKFIWPAIGLGVVCYCLLWCINIAFYNPVGDDWVTLVPTLTNIRWVGFFAVTSFCAGIALVPVAVDGEKNWKHLIIGLFFSTVGLIIAFWTGARGAIVAIMAATILSSFVFVFRRQIIFLTLSAAALALVATAGLPVVHPLYGVERIIDASKPSNGADSMSSGRLKLWAHTLGKIQQRPIAGWGIDQFRYSFSEGATGTRHPHQALLQLFFSHGLLGTLAILTLVFQFASQIPKKLSQSDQAGAITYIFAASVYGLYDGFFYYTYPVMILLVAMACVAVPNARKPETDTSS